MEDVHFRREYASFEDIGFKAAVANLSDMAAMGAQPHSLLATIAFHPTTSLNNLKALYRGMSIPCRKYGVRLIGGDTSRSPSLMFLGLTILGDVEPHGQLTRHGAKIGDLLYVSGTLGDSAGGLDYLERHKNSATHSKFIKYLVGRHLRPTPRIELGRLLIEKKLATAALDISDGLSGDLSHLCQQSQVGAHLYADQVPLSSHLQKYARQRHYEPLEWGLHGGEDYELLFSIPPQEENRLKRALNKLKLPVTCIGQVKPRRFGIRIEDAQGTRRPLTIHSHTHF